MRVLQVLPALAVGGAERMAVELSVACQKAGATVRMVSLFDEPNPHMALRLRSAGVEFVTLRKSPGLDLSMGPRLMTQFREFRPEVVHTHQYVLRYVLPLLWAVGVPGVHTVHNEVLREVGPAGRWVHQLAFRSKRALPVALSTQLAEQVGEYYGVPAVTIRIGIDLETFRNGIDERTEARVALGIDPQATVFACVGRLSKQKRVPRLVSAFGDAMVGASDVLLVVGEGPERPLVEQAHAQLGSRRDVRVLGVRRDVAQILAASDVLVLASEYEGTPLVIMEAMAAGVPVLATNVGGVSSLVSHGRDGWLVEGEDYQALVDGLSRLSASPSMRRALSIEARLRAQRDFDLYRMAADYLRLYEDTRGRG